MKLETISTIKGWVALVGLGWFLIAVFSLSPEGVRGLPGTLAGFAGIVGLVYTVKWFRMRRRIREWEYQARVRALG